MTNEMKDKIRKFIVEVCLKNKRTIEDDDSLFDKGIVDSVELLELVAFLEKEFGISIVVADISVAHFDTVNLIEQYVRKKLRS